MPTPTKPALSELEIGPNGMGDLVIGQPVPSGTALVRWNPAACAETGLAVGQPGAGQWQSTYPDDPDGPFQPDPFRIAVAGGVQGAPIIAIGANSPHITTAKGIHLGSGHEDVFAAYPDAASTDFSQSDVFSITGSGAHRLDIELLHPGMDPQWGGEVVAITVSDGSAPPRAVYGGDTGLGCSV